MKKEAMGSLLVGLVALVQIVLTKEIDSKSDLLQEESYVIPAEHRGVFTDYQDIHASFPSMITSKNLPSKYEPSGASSNLNSNSVSSTNNDAWALASRGETSKIKEIYVKCGKNSMKVNIEFDRPFHGVIFSKGHYSDPKCVHLPAGTGQLVANFDIFMNSCGMTTNDATSTAVSSSLGMYIENTIIVQYDPQVQEIWDQARKLRCTWYDFYEKAVTFRPFGVDMEDAVTANFLGDNIQCWMQIQVGKGPWASEVAGIVKIGQTMTMVLAIKDEENKFDMLVRNCVAHDGKHAPIQLVDEYGCIVRSKIMSKFQKVRNFGHSASVVSYAYFQAFKFPDSMNVHFQCVIQVCRHECPQPSCDATDSNTDYRELQYEEANKFAQRMGDVAPTANLSSSPAPIYRSVNVSTQAGSGKPRSMKLDRRSKRAAKSQDVNTQKIIQVVAPGDVAFSLPLNQGEETVSDKSTQPDINVSPRAHMICLSTAGFATGIITLILLLLLTCVVTVFLMIRLRSSSRFTNTTKDPSIYTNYHCPKHPSMPCACEPIIEGAATQTSGQFFIKLPNVQLARLS